MPVSIQHMQGKLSLPDTYLIHNILLGHYCDREGLPIPTGLCQQGYYCPEGQVSATPGPHICPAGHFCLEGSAIEAACPSGTYQVSR